VRYSTLRDHTAGTCDGSAKGGEANEVSELAAIRPESKNGGDSCLRTSRNLRLQLTHTARPTISFFTRKKDDDTAANQHKGLSRCSNMDT
jgi:hypothetical protein